MSAEALAAWRDDPVLFVRQVLKAEPDPWQADVLQDYRKHSRIALKACAGIGKTALLAWIIWNFLLTRPFPKIAATALTWSSLRDGLWAELAKWQQASPILTGVFEWSADRISHRQHKSRWWASARAWNKDADAEQVGLTLAGLHEDYIMAILDESGGMPKAVLGAAEGVLSNVGGTGGAKEAHIIQSGNPTHLSGPLFDACMTERHLWRVYEMTGDPDSPNRCTRQSLPWALEYIGKHGRDHPWVQARVFGSFPSRSDKYLIAMADFDAAWGRELPLRTPRIMGVDVAREGLDETVVAFREGDHLVELDAWGQASLVFTAGRVREHATEFEPDEIRTDDIGVGGGLTDFLRAMGLPVVPVNVGTSSPDPRYSNLRAFLNCKVMREHRFRAGQISIAPHLKDTTLMSEATGLMVDYSGVGEKLIVEPKSRFRSRTNGRSPDRWDAVVLAFATLPGGPHSALAAIRSSIGDPAGNLSDPNLTELHREPPIGRSRIR